MKYAVMVICAALIGCGIFFWKQYWELCCRRFPNRPLNPDEVPEKEKAFVGQSYQGIQAVKDCPVEELEVISDDGLKLKGRLIKMNPGTKKVAIGFHGYHAYGYRDMGRFCPLYREMGCDYLIITERTHDDSQGKYICFGYKERYDALKWVEKIIELYGEDVQIILHGVSMGAATVMMTSAMKQLPSQVKGIIQDCGYSNMYDESYYVLCRNGMKPFAARIIVDMMCFIGRIAAGCTIKDASPVDVIPESRIPALMIHGTADDYVPYRMLDLNAKAYGGQCECLRVEGAGHATSYLVDPEGYGRKVREFAGKIFK